MAVIVETISAEDIEYGTGDTEKTHPSGNTLNVHQFSLSSLSTCGPAGLAASATWDPGTIGIGSQVTTTIEVPGAEPGDMCLVSHDGLADEEIIISGRVTDSNTVLAVIINNTTDSVTPASGTLYALVFKFRA